MRYTLLLPVLLAVLFACSNPVAEKIYKPEINSISFDRSQIYVKEFITVQAGVTDKDKDELSYNWTADGGTFTNPKNNPTQWHAGSTAGTFTITLTVSDGTFTVEKSKTIKVIEM